MRHSRGIHARRFPVAPVPVLNLDFLRGSLNPLITFTRASSATYFDSTGTLQTATTNTPRFDYNPSTLAARGLLIEEQRTNSIRNNTMQGAVAGTPGTLPTNWSVSGLGTLTQQVVGTGTSNGINYIDIRFSGTTSTTQLNIRFEPATGIAASNGQTWAASVWTSVVAGDLTNITGSGSLANLYNSSSVYVGGLSFGAINTSLTLTRTSGAATIAVATTAYVQPQLYLTFSSGAAIDITLRIGLPQLEQGAFATSVIPTTTAAATRSADVASITGTNFSSWYNASEGTFYSASEIPTSVTSANRFVHEVNNNVATTGDKWDVRRTGTTAVRSVARVSTVSAGDRTINISSSIAKIASSLNSATFNLCVNGGAVSSQANAASAMPVVDRLFIGGGIDTPSLQTNGWIQRITYYPRRLSNAELQAITS